MAPWLKVPIHNAPIDCHQAVPYSKVLIYFGIKERVLNVISHQSPVGCKQQGGIIIFRDVMNVIAFYRNIRMNRV